MKQTKPIILLLASLVLGACGNNQTTSGSESTSSNPSSSSTSGTTTGGSSTSTGATTGSSESSSGSSSTSTQPAVSLTIAEANAMGEALKANVPSGSHEYWDTTAIEIKGRVIQCIPIGLSQNALVYLADGSNQMIPVFSGTASNTLYNKCIDYVGKETSNYTITGTIGYYYGQPCIKYTSYTLDQNMSISVDPTKIAYDTYTTIASLNDYIETLEYNKKGYGEGHIVKLEGAKCIAKADNNSWIFTDGQHAQSVYYQTSNTAFTIGKVYDVYGISNTYQWKPSIRALYSATSTKEVEFSPTTVEKTAAQLYSLGAPKEDIEKCTATTNFVRTFKYFYTANLYFNYYTESGMYYIVAGDTYSSSAITSKETAATKGLIKFNNASFNRISSVGDIQNLPVKDYVGEDIQLETLIVPYQYTTINKKEVPQVYLFEDYVPRLSYPEAELSSFFSGQTYLISEGQTPIFDGGDEYEIITKTSSTFEMYVTNVTMDEFNAHISECNANTHITYKSDLSSDTKKVYKQNQANSKFTYSFELIEDTEVVSGYSLSIIYTK